MADARSSWLGEEVVALLTEKRRPESVFEAGSAPAQRVEGLGKAKVKLCKESEKRKFRDRIKADYAPALDDDALLDHLMPPKSKLGSMRLEKHLEMFLVDETPLFLAQEDNLKRQQLVPTVAALQRCPHLVRQLAIYGPVRKNILRGAELFFPGVLGAGDLSSESSHWPRTLCGGPFAKSDLVALVADGDPIPFAVGRFAMSDSDALLHGLRGTIVELIFRGFRTDHTDLDLVRNGLDRILASRADRRAAIAVLQEDRRAAEAAITAAMEVDQLRKDFRRIEKALRQIETLKESSGLLNSDQQAKLDREPALRSELLTIEQRLADALAPPHASEDENPKPEPPPPPPEEAEDEAAPEEEEDHQSDEDDAGDDDDKAEEEEEDVDGHFLAALLTVLETRYFPRTKRKEKKTPLSNEVFGLAAKLSGTTVKETRWKKGGRFLEECGYVVSRERSPGVTEIVDVDWTSAPAFETIEAPAVESNIGPKAKKRGGRVTVSVRRVRNKNCTFVDGLDSWGYSEADMRSLAATFRSRYAASASVAPRKGTLDNKSGKTFWSIMVQGKYADQIATTLRRDLGVTDVGVQAQKGLITKFDRAANV